MALSASRLRPLWRQKCIVTPLQVPACHFASQVSPQPPPAFPTIEKCPSPNCLCEPTPQGLDIDHEKPLSGSMPAYTEHVIICTGKDDWKSRIEDEKNPNLANGLKTLLRPRGRGLKGLVQPQGRLYDPDSNIMITNSSIPSVSPGISSTGGGGIVEGNFRSTSSAVYLFPSFQFVSKLSHNEEAYEEFINFLRKDPNSRSIERSGRRVKEVVVLICGHGARDKRCGIMGPVLLSQFESSLKTAGIPVADKYSAPDVTQPERERSNAPDRGEARVALVSHIGGHRFAGNVVIYIPPDYMMDGKPSPLAGKGIWYGRVEPKHVEGIIEETIKSGNVISELFRGGIGSKGEFLTL